MWYNKKGMFVSIAVDPGSEERAKELAELLIQYGFEKIQRGLWESTAVSPETLGRLKRDLDRSTDAFDRLRIFQFPVNGTLALSTLRDKKWRRLIAKGGDNPVKAAAAQAAPVPARTAARPVRHIRHGRRATDL
jgi:CRISPR-associated protein Cas2